MPVLSRKLTNCQLPWPSGQGFPRNWMYLAELPLAKLLYALLGLTLCQHKRNIREKV